MPSALALILCSAFLAPDPRCAGSGGAGPRLAVEAEHGWTDVTALARTQWIVLPLCSRSERVTRIARRADGARLALHAAPGAALEVRQLELVWVAHASGERLIAPEHTDEKPWLASEPRLVRAARTLDGGHDVLAELARQDGEGVEVPIVIEPGAFAAGERLLAFGLARAPRAGELPPVLLAEDERGTYLALHGPEQAWRASMRPLEGLPAGALRIGAPGDIALDQLVIVRGRLITEEARRSVAPRGPVSPIGTLAAGRTLEFALDVPPPGAEGTTWSLLVHIRTASETLVELRPEPRGPDGLFRDVTRASGLAYQHLEGPDEQLDIRPTMGPGAALGDVDGDGWVDVFVPAGGGREGSEAPRARLFRNLGDGRFSEVGAASGLDLSGAGMGALFFDADGDRDLDLFVAHYGRNRLLLNDGRGRFRDATESAGLPAEERWHAGVAAADTDRDGDLELYVTAYLRYDPAAMPGADELGRYRREDPLEMLPFAFPGERNTFLRNLGGARFADATDELKLADAAGRGMQAVFWDFDRDGDQDLYVANDVSPNSFFRNEGDGRFRDISLSTGLDDPRGCMGLAPADVDQDGDEDLFITNWQLESNALYLNNAVAHASAKHRVSTFRDQAVEAGVAQLSVGVTGWGCVLEDFDLDADLDLACVNGYTSPDYESTGICVGQPAHYFEGDGRGKFRPALERAGADLARPLASRCLLAADFDQDGDLDLLITANNGPLRLLRNETPRGRHWLGLRLRGRGGNTHAIGAEVTLRAGGKLLRRWMRAGTSYLGGNAPELHFGLGEAAQLDECSVRWPDGSESKHELGAVDRFVTLAQP